MNLVLFNNHSRPNLINPHQLFPVVVNYHHVSILAYRIILINLKIKFWKTKKSIFKMQKLSIKSLNGAIASNVECQVKMFKTRGIIIK